jgi:hypothetical protein
MRPRYWLRIIDWLSTDLVASGLLRGCASWTFTTISGSIPSSTASFSLSRTAREVDMASQDKVGTRFSVIAGADGGGGASDTSARVEGG